MFRAYLTSIWCYLFRIGIRTPSVFDIDIFTFGNDSLSEAIKEVQVEFGCNFDQQMISFNVNEILSGNESYFDQLVVFSFRLHQLLFYNDQ